MYILDNIDYPYNALEPNISERTLDIHHNKHHKKYLDNLNKLLNENNYDYRYTKEQLVNKIDIFPIKDRGNILFKFTYIILKNTHILLLGDRFERKTNK